MTKSAFVKYDPSNHDEEFGWMWIDYDDGTFDWVMVFTFFDDEVDCFMIQFVEADQTGPAEDYAGQPFMVVSRPPAPGTETPGFILTLDDHRGVRTMFSWADKGGGSPDFSNIVRSTVERALIGGELQ